MTIQDLMAAFNPWWADPRQRSGVSHPHRRELWNKLYSTLRTDPAGRRAQVLVGPRQVGKSTLLRQIADALLDSGWPASDLTYFDFSDERATVSVGVREVVELEPAVIRKARPRIFLLDEITRAPEWDRALKSLVDRARRDAAEVYARFLVTDSAASLLRSGAKDSLQGRIDEHRISGLSLREFVAMHAAPEESIDGVARRLPNVADRYLSLGGFPEHALAEPSDEVRRRLREDIVDRAIARDLARQDVDIEPVRALFVSLVQDSGGVFEAAGRARDLDAGLQSATDVRSMRKYLRILEEASLITSLLPRLGDPKSKRLGGSRRLRARPKVWAEDHGMIPAFAPLPNPMARDDVRGKVLEAAVLRHLRTFAAERGDVELSYFRANESEEIDFVLDLEARSVGVEVTVSRNPQKKLERLRKARNLAQLDEVVLVHGGIEEGFDAGLRFVPYPRFLLDPARYLDGAAR